jgi:hypothetical protein
VVSSFRGRFVAVLGAALVAGALSGPVAAQASGLSGTVTDAYTGLGLAGTSVAWGSGAPVSTESSGRYVLLNLPPSDDNTLNVTGPPGYEKLAIDNIMLPATASGAQNVLLHRDWSSSAGGATLTTNDDTNAPAGCGGAAATDNDRTTGWSATVASHPDPASDPAQITIALPQPVDLRQLVIDPTASCGHAAGAALGAYDILTSTDGNTYNLALSGTLDATTRGTGTTLTPTANTSQVRFVRLQALAPQDPASATIDLRELQVFGLGPGTPPAGTLAPATLKNYVKQAIHLHAAFTDAGAVITKYLWDFDGDGRWDQATVGPDVAHVWMAAGGYHVIVGVRDYRGALGTAATDLRVVDPTAPVEPILQRKPLITFDPVDGIDLPVRIACASTCTFTASLVLPKSTARRIHAPRRTIFTMRKRTEGPGLGSWTIELPGKTIRLLRKAKKKSVRAYLTASAVDQQKRRSTTRRWVTFR